MSSRIGLNQAPTFVSLANCRDKWPLVEAAFRRVIGDQNQATLEDIQRRRKRKTELLTLGKDGREVGCVVYQRNLVDWRDHQMEECLDVSLLALFYEGDATLGYRSKLLKRVEKVAHHARAQYITCTLPTTARRYIGFFKKHDFKAGGSSDKECFLYKQLRQCRSPKRSPKAVQEKRKRRESGNARGSGRNKAVKRASGGTYGKIHVGKGQYELTLKRQFIAPIRRGIKTIEVRINSGAPARMRAGDTLRLFYPQNQQDDVTCTIVKVERYNGFREVLQATGYQKCIPYARSLDDAVRVYESIPNYTQRANRSGVVAIHLALQ